MFKNAIAYRATAINTAQDDLTSLAFVPCGASQEKSIGWVPPRGEAHGPLVEVVAGQRILKLMTETKAVPADVVQRKANERAEQILATQGRKPGKKEMKEIKEDVKMALLPNAFSKRTTNLVWFTPDGFVVIDASSHARADEVVTMLIQSFEGLSLTLIQTQMSPQAAMAAWLITQESPAGFSIDRECELKAADESKAVVKYGRHPLDIDEVKAHVESGKLPTKLAMTYEARASFVLTEVMTLKKIQLLDIAFEGTNDTEADGFDADVVLMSGELSKVLHGLIDVLGGELKIEGE
jgi:recombination associated protein RdgC